MINLIRYSLFSIVFFFIHLAYAETNQPTIFQVTETNITVNGKQSRVFDIKQPDGTFGYYGKKGDFFNVIVENKTRVPLVLHWHGIIDPNDQDGVPYVTQLPIKPGEKYAYHFKLQQAGTYWFHSHYKLQEQKLMAAPLIIYDPAEKKQKEVLMFIQDFTFENPVKIYETLRKREQNPSSMPRMNMNKMDMSKMTGSTSTMMSGNNMNMKAMNMSQKNMPMKMDLTDVKFDAYLTNKRTLQNPDIKRVEPGDTIRLRIINASASSNYTIDLGKLNGTLIAVDGESIQPITGSRFQISIGNRLDIEIKIPQGENVYPVFALPEGTKQQTGLILATKNAKIPVFSEYTTVMNPALSDSQELNLKAKNPMTDKPVDRSLVYNLSGDMQNYRWTMNGQEWPNITPYVIKPHERIELVFNNNSGMSHPMHIHGHTFQVTEVGGQKINGRKGDTVNVMPNSSMKVIFDSDNPGIWMLHCHILYHQAGGMMTTINYEGYPDRFTKQQREEGEKLYQTAVTD